jgi:hypothetical protein
MRVLQYSALSLCPVILAALPLPAARPNYTSIPGQPTGRSITVKPRADTLYPGYTTPAGPGETAVLHAEGFGATFPAAVAGSPVQSGTRLI